MTHQVKLFPGGWRFHQLVLAGLVLLSFKPMEVKAADKEIRDFQVLVDSKPAGAAKMVFDTQDDGTTSVTSETDVAVRFLVFSYKYTYRGQEVWKEGRLQSLSSSCTDDGKSYQVQGQADQGVFRLRANNQERNVSADIWLSSYWKQPESKFVNQAISVIDCDTGKDLGIRVQFVGPEKRTIGGQAVQVQHYRMAGKIPVDVWYDGNGRMVRQEWVEQGHRTTVELLRIQRQ